MNSIDLIKWIIKILIKSNNNCDVYNVGSDEIISIKELAKIISLKFKKKVISRKTIKYNKSHDFYVPSIDKAKKVLNLKIKFKLKKSLNMLYKS